LSAGQESWRICNWIAIALKPKHFSRLKAASSAISWVRLLQR